MRWIKWDCSLVAAGVLVFGLFAWLVGVVLEDHDVGSNFDWFAAADKSWSKVYRVEMWWHVEVIILLWAAEDWRYSCGPVLTGQ